MRTCTCDADARRHSWETIFLLLSRWEEKMSNMSHVAEPRRVSPQNLHFLIYWVCWIIVCYTLQKRFRFLQYENSCPRRVHKIPWKTPCNIIKKGYRTSSLVRRGKKESRYCVRWKMSSNYVCYEVSLFLLLGSNVCQRVVSGEIWLEHWAWETNLNFKVVFWGEKGNVFGRKYSDEFSFSFFCSIDSTRFSCLYLCANEKLVHWHNTFSFSSLH